MSKKNKIFLILFLTGGGFLSSLACYASVFDTFYATSKKDAKTDIFFKKNHFDLERRHSIEGYGENFRLYVSYPSVGKAVIDANLRYWALQQVELFTRSLEEIQDVNGKFSLLITYQCYNSLPRCVSIIFFSVTEMGNSLAEHGMAAFTFDMLSGAAIKLDDLFAQPAALLHFLSAYCYSHLSKQQWAVTAPNLLVAGTAPHAANFSFFSLESQGIRFHFPESQIAEAEFGPQSLLVPLSALVEFAPKLEYWNPGRSFSSDGK